MDKKFKFGGTFGYGDLFLQFKMRHLKIFRLHAILHYAARRLRTHNVIGPGFCRMIGRGLISCMLGHVTGLLLSFYENLFLRSYFNFVDF